MIRYTSQRTTFLQTQVARDVEPSVWGFADAVYMITTTASKNYRLEATQKELEVQTVYIYQPNK